MSWLWWRSQTKGLIVAVRPDWIRMKCRGDWVLRTLMRNCSDSPMVHPKPVHPALIAGLVDQLVAVVVESFRAFHSLDSPSFVFSIEPGDLKTKPESGVIIWIRIWVRIWIRLWIRLWIRICQDDNNLSFSLESILRVPIRVVIPSFLFDVSRFGVFSLRLILRRFKWFPFFQPFFSKPKIKIR